MKAAIFIAFLFFAADVATAAELRLVPQPGPKSAVPASTVSIQAYGDRDATCQVWTDGCRNCERTDKGPSCSNIGIACQPGAIRCTTRKEGVK